MRRSLLFLCAWMILAGSTARPFQLNPTANQHQSNTEDHHQPTQPVVLNVAGNNTQADKPQVTAKNEPNHVKITEMPPPDWWYRISVLATLLLVVVGGLGIRYAIRTLNAIEKQGRTMERQEKILAASVAVAERSANAALTASQVAAKEIKIAMERERPRIGVEVSDLRLNDPAMCGVSYSVDCWCPTPAFIVEAWIHLGVDLGESSRPSGYYGIPIGKQVRESQKFNFHVQFMKPLTQEIRDNIVTQKNVVWLWGYIAYRGVQLSPNDPPYKTYFRMKWLAVDLTDDPEFGVDFSSWERMGKAEDNQQT